MNMKAEDWDREEHEALNGVHEELEALRARHTSDPPVDLLRAARGHVLPDDLQSDADRWLAENAWSRTLLDGLDAEASSLSRADEDRLLSRIKKAASSEHQSSRWTWVRLPVVAAAAAVALVATTWIVWRAAAPKPVAPQPEGIVVTSPTPPAAPAFLLPLDKPEVKLSSAALTWRGAGAENAFLTDLKPALESYRGGDYQAAEREFSRLLPRYPKSIEVLFYQGVTRLFLNDALGAIERLAQADAIADETFSGDVAWYRAVADERAGNVAAVRDRLTRLCARPGERAEASCGALKKLEARSQAPR
jgi:hypothetical protein